MVKSGYAPQSFPRKDPDAKIIYALDWTDWLLDDEVIESSTVSVVGADKINDTHTDKETRVIIAGGEPGTIAKVHFHVVSNTGLEDDRTISLEIVER